MREIRLVGRGGHGVVTAGELLGKAAVMEGLHAQSIPTFGPERRGALCSCTVRIGSEPIRLKCGPTSPDVLLVMDPSIWRHVPVTRGIEEDSVLVFNSSLPPDELRDALKPEVERFTLFAVDATDIALRVLQRAITNTAMLGALAAATDVVRMQCIEQVIRERFGEDAGRNLEAARAARAALRRLD